MVMCCYISTNLNGVPSEINPTNRGFNGFHSVTLEDENQDFQISPNTTCFSRRGQRKHYIDIIQQETGISYSLTPLKLAEKYQPSPSQDRGRGEGGRLDLGYPFSKPL